MHVHMASVSLIGCRFESNKVSPSYEYSAGALLLLTLEETGSIDSTVFTNNQGGWSSAISVVKGQAEPGVSITDCSFESNLGGGNTLGGVTVWNSQGATTALIHGSYFENNFPTGM